MKFTVTGRMARFESGVRIELSAAQAGDRRHLVSKGADGWHTVTGPSIEFREGEVVGLDHTHKSLPPHLQLVLQPEGVTKSPKR